MHLVAVVDGMGPVGELVPAVRVRAAVVAQGHEILGQAMRDIDAESVDATVRPEPQRALEVRLDLGVRPVEVGLRRVEQVQVPLAILDPLPRRGVEPRPPVRRRELPPVPAAIGEDVAPAGARAGLGAQGFLEPGVLVRAVVRDDVDDDLDAAAMALAHEHVEVVERPEAGSTSR